MARIPLGDFGHAIAQPGQSVRITQAAFDDGGSGAQKLGDTAIHVAGAVMDEQRQQQEALNRASAANTVLDREIAVKTIAQDIEQQLADGRLHYKDAPAAYKSRIGELGMPDTKSMDPVTTENLTRGIKRTDFVGETSVGHAVDRARTADFKGQTDLALDKLGKLAGMPGADVEAIAKQAHSLDALGQVAYGKNWEGKKQEFSDKVWFNEATQRAMQNRDNLDGLKALESELTDAGGRYSGKLDTDKRNIVLRSVINDRMRLENKIQHNADRMEAKAEKTINEIDRQLSSGVPASPEMWDAWATTVKGTSFEGDFRQRIQDEAKVQEVLRMPIEQQRTFVQQREAELLNGGGSVRDKTNLDRLRSAVDANLKQLQEAPLLFAQNRTGQPVQPLDIAALADPNGAGKVADTMRDRIASITALQKQYGPQVQMKPLLPQEAQFLTRALDQASPKQQTELFGTLRNAIGDDAAFTAAMQQIAPDSPVKALAGILMAKQRKITLEKNWIASDVTATGGDVGEIMLEGEGLLNKTKGQKAEDGKAKGFPLPPEKEFRDQFSSVAGKVFGGRPQAYETAIQAVRAYYTGKAAQDGDVSGQIDGTRMKQAITAVLGEVVNYNGNGEVLAPWGMDKGTFKDKVKASFASEIKARGMPDSARDQLPALGLKNIGDGSYYVVQGRNFLYDPNGQPVIIKVQP